MTSKTSPKLTIIIPTYNVGKYIDQALDSVLSQTLKDIEIICIDDGSSDDTVQVIEDRRQKEPRIKLFHQEHQGAGPARNLGLQEAHGTFVAFLDGDDFYLDEDALERMYDAAIEQRANVCASYRKICYLDKMEELQIFRDFDCEGKSFIWVNFMDYQNDLHFHSYIYSRKFLQEHEIVFPPYIRNQDPPFLLNVMTQTKCFLLVPVFLYCHRQGHKALHMTELQVYHMLKGIYDNIIMAHKYHYDKLYEQLLYRINHKYYEQIASNLSPRVIQELLNINMIHCSVFPMKPLLRLLDVVKTSVQNLQYEQYVFPYHKIKKGMRIMLYGASHVGKALCYQFKMYGAGYGEIVGIIDRDTSVFIDESTPVFPIENIHKVHFDVIVLATENIDVAEDMRKILVENGISENSIVWCERAYKKKAFYSEIYLPSIEAHTKFMYQSTDKGD